tara:strand:+ start:1418 stop:1591 length:174 start_codon:yes stop_codon:yes gene_type:complete
MKAIIFDLPGRRPVINSSHRIDPQSVAGPFPNGEGPADYAECAYGCDDLRDDCEEIS